MGREPIPGDPRRKRSIFPLKNPRNFPMRKLITAGEKNQTISYGHKKSLEIQKVVNIVEMRTRADPNT
jgi:hypothetical protein